MSIHSWFPTSIYITELQPSLKVQDNMINYVERFYEKNRYTNKDSNLTGDVHGDYKIFQKSTFSWLNKQISIHIEKYLDDLGVDTNNIIIYASKAWPTVVSRGGNVSRHKHKNSILSAVFYLKTGDEESGKLNFYSSHSEMYFIPVPIKKGHGNNHTVGHYMATPNRLVIFPSTLEHEVGTYTGEEIRCSVSYDIMITSVKNDSSEFTISHPSEWKELC